MNTVIQVISLTISIVALIISIIAYKNVKKDA